MASRNQIAFQITFEYDELEREHDEALARLRHDMKRVQSAVDQYLILQGRPRRYAVKLNADNTIAALMVLEH